MSTATLTDKDMRVRDAVLQQLEWDPAFDGSGIGVTAHGGAVTLTGSINTYAGKLAAERAAKRVVGVRAADAATMLKLHKEVPDSVQAAVHHGHVTLTGTVDWHYQRMQAEKAVCHISGVRHVADRITVVPRAAGHDMHRRITKALYRNASLDAKRIEVTVTGSVAHLKGTATSW